MIVNWLPAALQSRKSVRSARSKTVSLCLRGRMRFERLEDRVVLSPQVILSPTPVGGFATGEGGIPASLSFDNVPVGTNPGHPGIQIANDDALAVGDKQTVTITTTGGMIVDGSGGFTIVGTNKHQVQMTGTIAAINADLASGKLVFVPDTSDVLGGPDFLGSANVTVKDHDWGNGSTILPSNATASFSINVVPNYGLGNNIPTLTVGGVQGGGSPILTLAPLSTLPLDATHGAAIVLYDPNVPTTDNFDFTALIPNDAANNPIVTLTLPGLTPTQTNLGGSTLISWSGTLAQIQAALGNATLTVNAGATSSEYPPIILTATDVTHNPVANTTVGFIHFNVQKVNPLAPTLVVGTNTGYNSANTPVDAAVAPNLTVAGPDITRADVFDDRFGDDLYINPALLTGSRFTGTNIVVTATGNILTLTGLDSAANYQLALEAVHFVDTKGDSASIRQVTITANNGGAVSLPVTSVLAPTPIETTVTLSHITATVNENSSNNPVAGVQLTDPNYVGPIQVVLTPTTGKVGIDTTSGVTVVPNAPGAPPGTLTFFGSLDQVNAALIGLTYTPAPNVTGSASVNLVATELVGAGVSVADVSVNILPFDAAPVIGFEGPIKTSVDTPVSLGIIVFDPHATTETVVVSVGSGGLAGTAMGAATLTVLSPHSLQIAGTRVDVNATLATLEYTPLAGFVGSDTITVTASDGTNVSVDAANITIKAIGVAPTINGPTSTPAAIVGGGAVAIGGLNVTNNDLPPSKGNLTVTVSSLAGVKLNATGATGNGTNSLTITGSPSKVNAELSTLTLAAGDGVAPGAVAVNVTATESLDGASSNATFNVQVQAGVEVSGGNLGQTIGYRLHKAASTIFGNLTVTDHAVANFAGGLLDISMAGSAGGDRLSIRTGAGVQISGSKIKVGGVAIGTLTSTATHLQIALNSHAAPSNLETLLGAIAFRATRLGTLDRTVDLSLTDGASSVPATGSVQIHVRR